MRRFSSVLTVFVLLSTAVLFVEGEAKEPNKILPDLYMDLGDTKGRLPIILAGIINANWTQPDSIVIPEDVNQVLLKLNVLAIGDEAPLLRRLVIKQSFENATGYHNETIVPLLKTTFPQIRNSSNQSSFTGESFVDFGCRSKGKFNLKGTLVFSGHHANDVNSYYTQVFTFQKVCGPGDVPGLSIYERGYLNRFVIKDGYVNPEFHSQGHHTAFSYYGSFNYFTVDRSPELYDVPISWEIETGNGDLKASLSGDATKTTNKRTILEVFYTTNAPQMRTSITIFGTVASNPPRSFSFSWTKIYHTGPIPGFDVLVDRHQFTPGYIVSSDGVVSLGYRRYGAVMNLPAGNPCLQLNVRARGLPVDIVSSTSVVYRGFLRNPWNHHLRPRPLQEVNDREGHQNREAINDAAHMRQDALDNDLQEIADLEDDQQKQNSDLNPPSQPNLTVMMMDPKATVTDEGDTISICHSCHRSGIFLVGVNMTIQHNGTETLNTFYYTKSCRVGSYPIDVTPGLYVPFLSQYYAVRKGVTQKMYLMDSDKMQVREEEDSTFFYVTSLTPMTMETPEIYYNQTQSGFSASVRLVGFTDPVMMEDNEEMHHADEERQVNDEDDEKGDAFSIGGQQTASIIEVKYFCKEEGLYRVIVSLLTTSRPLDLSFSFLKKCSASSNNFFISTDLEHLHFLLSNQLVGSYAMADVVNSGVVQDEFLSSNPSHYVPQFESTFSFYIASKSPDMTVKTIPLVSSAAPSIVSVKMSGTLTYATTIEEVLSMEIQFTCRREGTTRIDFTMTLSNTKQSSIPVKFAFYKSCEAPKALNTQKWLNVLLIVGSVSVTLLLVPIVIKYVLPRFRAMI